MILVRQEIGEVLRDFRQQKGRTLRQVASRASVALGYLSEVERGQKEASSEILASVAEALDVPVYLHRDDQCLYDAASQQAALFGSLNTQQEPTMIQTQNCQL